MLAMDEVKALAGWCEPRAIRWQPVSRGHMPAVMLELTDARQCWQRMVLSFDNDDFELMTETGEILASASDLTSVLDALEGGVAELLSPVVGEQSAAACVA